MTSMRAASPESIRFLTLRDLYAERAVRRGDFTLASGRKSDLYVNSKLVFLNAHAAQLIGILTLQALRGWDPDAIGGLEVGAIPPVAAAVSRASFLGIPTLEGFFVRKTPKTHGDPALIEGRVRAGDRVVVVEDVLTTGQSAWKAVEAVRAAGASVVGLFALVDRTGEDPAGVVPGLAGVPRRHLFTPADFGH